MPKASKSSYYAVRIGRAPGIYPSWEECEAQIKGFPCAQYKKLSTEVEANAFMAAKPSAAKTSGSRDIVPVAFTSGITIGSNRKVQASPLVDATEQDFEVVYCDGACKGNGQSGSVAGIGVWWGHGDPRNISERCPGDQTNNRAELFAIVRILETTPHLKRPLLIKTDSNYSIQCVTSWVFSWMKNGFLASNGKPVKNRTLIKYLAALLHARRKTFQTVQFEHVRGHAGIEGNEAADRLANFGTTMPMVPERDWQKLENEVRQGIKPVFPAKVADDDLKVYADACFSDDEFTDLIDTNVSSSVLPILGLRHEEPTTYNQTPLLPPGISPPPPNATALTAARLSDEARLLSGEIFSYGGSSGPKFATVAQSVSSKKPLTAISKIEMEAFGSCLLSDDELLNLGKDGVFDSDF